MKVLISRPDKIGDVVLALHGIKQLKKMLSNVSVYLHVSSYTKPLVENIKFLDGVIEIGEDIKPFNFDAVVDLMAKNETSSLYNDVPIKIKIGNSARWFRHRYNRTKYIRRSYAMLNEAEYNWQLISLLDKSLKNTPLRESLSEDDFKIIIPYNKYKDYTLILPGVAVSAKSWELHEWINLAKLQAEKNKVIILLGPAETKLLNTFTELVKDNPNIAIEQISDFPSLFGLIQASKNFVGPSTGVTHLASAFQKPGVALYPEIRSMHPRRWLPFKSSLSVVSISRDSKANHVAEILHGKELPDLNPLSRAKVSAFIICYNEEKNIARCLESVKWCDEIIVVDSGSTDQTREIARQYTDKIFIRPWNGHSEQKQFALEKCSNEWVLNIDSDEEVSPELRAQLINILINNKNTPTNINGYHISRIVYFLGRWWEHGGWYPEYRLRFFKRSETRWGGVNPHEKAIVNGKTKFIKEPIYHFTYTDFKHQIDSLNKHSSLSAQNLYKDGKRCNFHNLIINPIFRFFKFYVMKMGFREGYPGLIVAGIEASYTFFKYLKLWEIEKQELQRPNREAKNTEKNGDPILEKSA
jgi:ADP-heptose:LPS heptosyltransferase/glycosyltransferase involved in cell wall biosynthesis